MFTQAISNTRPTMHISVNSAVWYDMEPVKEKPVARGLQQDQLRLQVTCLLLRRSKRGAEWH